MNRFQIVIEQFRRDLIIQALRAHDGNRTRTARTLGIQRTYLLRLIREYHIDVPPPTRLSVLPNSEERGILNRIERRILNTRTVGAQGPVTRLASLARPWAPSQAFWTALLAASQGPTRSRPRLYSKQVASHVFDPNQIPALSEVHRQSATQRE